MRHVTVAWIQDWGKIAIGHYWNGWWNLKMGCALNNSIRSMFNFFFFFWTHCMACVILVSWPGIKHELPALDAQSFNHPDCQEGPMFSFLTSTVLLWLCKQMSALKRYTWNSYGYTDTTSTIYSSKIYFNWRIITILWQFTLK